MRFFLNTRHPNIPKPKCLAFEIHNTRFYFENSVIVITYKMQTNPIHGCKELHNTKDVILDKFHEKAIRKF